MEDVTGTFLEPKEESAGWNYLKQFERYLKMQRKTQDVWESAAVNFQVPVKCL